MRIIINCGYNHSLSKIIILKNGQHATTYSPNEGVYELDAKEGDSISIKLRFLDFFHQQSIPLDITLIITFSI